MARMTEFGGSGSTKHAAMYAKKAIKYAKKALECLEGEDWDDDEDLDERWDDPDMYPDSRRISPMAMRRGRR